MLRSLVAICLLRAGPQELPWSPRLLALALLADALVSLLYLAPSPQPGPAAAMLALSLALSAGFLWLLLQLRGRSHRFVQAASAIFGTDAIVTLAALPLALTATGADGALTPAWALYLLALLSWNIAVLGHIYRHALDLPWPAGIAIAVAHVFVSAGLVA